MSFIHTVIFCLQSFPGCMIPGLLFSHSGTQKHCLVYNLRKLAIYVMTQMKIATLIQPNME